MLSTLLLGACDAEQPKPPTPETAGISLFPDQLTSPLAGIINVDRNRNIAKVLAERDVCQSEKSAQYRQSNWLVVSNQ
ncbi:hypothetical protein ED236_04800 [Pseudomethylobacillus aquaticus]|uniref:Uncharacterized protein n=2 Tax=Pseudomethylobacillus aquaticus TaxID=2676064 RepID=A0A3N0V388_9PROT|nr:hypothetical protein ED236_04800 [Pseudomethylobacillus aquaticus]